MNTADKLEKLLGLAKEKEELKQNLLNTRSVQDPLAEFCRISTDAGVELSVMDIVNQGEEFYAEIKRSTNGGGENSPDLDFQNDEYSIFMMRLEDL